MPSAGGARNDLHISESGFREDGLWYEAALPARPLSPYAAAGFQLSPPPHVGENDGVDLRGRAQDVVGHGLCGDDVPLQGRLRASAGPSRSASAAPGLSAGLPPWTAPEMRYPYPLSLYGTQPPPIRLPPPPHRGASLSAARKKRAIPESHGAAEMTDGQVHPPVVGGQPVPATGFSQSAAHEKPAHPASRGVAGKPQSQVPPSAVAKKAKQLKKVKTAEEKLETLSTDLKALTKEWMACKGELVTVHSLLATLTRQVNASLENSDHVLDIVRHMAEKPPVAEPPVGAASVAQPQLVKPPPSARAQASLTMRWFKSLKVRFRSVHCLLSLCLDTVVPGSMWCLGVCFATPLTVACAALGFPTLHWDCERL